jgi:hypothetical protein
MNEIKCSVLKNYFVIISNGKHRRDIYVLYVMQMNVDNYISTIIV